jgi:hypothetical protein
VSSRRNHDNPHGALKIPAAAAENTVVTTRTPAKKAAKPKPPAKSAAKRATPKLPRQRAKRVAAPAPAATPVQTRAARRPRPMIALARRNDGKGLSFVERLSERRHAQFKHPGPVCYRCKMHASQLASAAHTA